MTVFPPLSLSPSQTHAVTHVQIEKVVLDECPGCESFMCGMLLPGAEGSKYNDCQCLLDYSAAIALCQNRRIKPFINCW